MYIQQSEQYIRKLKACSVVQNKKIEDKDNIVRFIVNSSPLLLYELNILRVSSPGTVTGGA